MKRIALILITATVISAVSAFVFSPYAGIGIIGGSDGPTGIFIAGN
ncbi:MAG: hypothetical protein Q4D26_06755 [Clostridia bacterium]|nr:hypothetical protein [Clostridia bacterium]